MPKDDSEDESEDSDDESEHDAYAESDALLAEMRRFKLEASAAMGDIDKSEASNDLAAVKLHDRLNETAAGIIAKVVSGEPEEAEEEARPPHAGPNDGVLLEEAATHWSPPSSTASSRISGVASVAAPSGGSSRFARDGGCRPDSGVGSVLSDISRLASRPLIADDVSFASRPGAPRRPAPLTSSSDLGAFAVGRGAPGRGRGRLGPR